MIHFSPSNARIWFHLLAFMLIVAAPLWGWYLLARVKAAPSSRNRLLVYRLGIVSLMLGTLAAFLLVYPTTFFDIQIQTRGTTWLPSRELISGLAIGLVLMTALPLFLARRSKPFQITFQRQIQKLRDLLPHTRREKVWFAAAAVCAGACEEVLYRGFLLHYLHVFPWHVNIGSALVVSCLVFGIVHLFYQGINGILQTFLLALGLSVLFLSTRSLLLPIVLHVLVDLRIFTVLPSIMVPIED